MRLAPRAVIASGNCARGRLDATNGVAALPLGRDGHRGWKENGAGEGIRTLDPNLGKSRSDLFHFNYNALYWLLKSEHDPKMVSYRSEILRFLGNRGVMRATAKVGGDCYQLGLALMPELDC